MRHRKSRALHELTVKRLVHAFRRLWLPLRWRCRCLHLPKTLWNACMRTVDRHLCVQLRIWRRHPDGGGMRRLIVLRRSVVMARFLRSRCESRIRRTGWFVSRVSLYLSSCSAGNGLRGEMGRLRPRSSALHGPELRDPVPKWRNNDGSDHCVGVGDRRDRLGVCVVAGLQLARQRPGVASSLFELVFVSSLDVLVEMPALGEGLPAHGAAKVTTLQMHIGNVLGQVAAPSEAPVAGLARKAAFVTVDRRHVLFQMSLCCKVEAARLAAVLRPLVVHVSHVTLQRTFR